MKLYLRLMTKAVALIWWVLVGVLAVWCFFMGLRDMMMRKLYSKQWLIETGEWVGENEQWKE